jgi:hypothetical protein
VFIDPFRKSSKKHRHRSRCSIVVSIPACHAGDPGSIPGNGVFFCIFVSFYFFLSVLPGPCLAMAATHRVTVTRYRLCMCMCLTQVKINSKTSLGKLHKCHQQTRVPAAASYNLWHFPINHV